MTTISTPGARYTAGARAEPGALPPAVSPLAGSRVLVLLIVLGIAIRAWAYFSNVSLWLDELLVSRNILGLPLSHLLTKPLLLDQVAPRGFLLLEKLAVDTLGGNELALRFFPFVCSVASVLIFHRLTNRALGGWGPAIALGLFAIGIPFIQYGVEVKQYIFDATAAMLLLYLALTLRDPGVPTQRLVLTGLAAFVIIWFSQASVVVMGGIGAAFAVEWLIGRERRTARALLITIPLWAVASLVAILAGLRSMTPSTREFMDDFWGTGFLPLPFTLSGTLRWLWAQSLSMFTDPTLLRYPLAFVFVALSLLGIVSLWRTRRDVALIVLGPFALAVLAAAAHQYPLRGRLMLPRPRGCAGGRRWSRATPTLDSSAQSPVSRCRRGGSAGAARHGVCQGSSTVRDREQSSALRVPAARAPTWRRGTHLPALARRRALLRRAVWAEFGGMANFGVRPERDSCLRSRRRSIPRRSATLARVRGLAAVQVGASRRPRLPRDDRRQARLAVSPLPQPGGRLARPL